MKTAGMLIVLFALLNNSYFSQEKGKLKDFEDEVSKENVDSISYHNISDSDNEEDFINSFLTAVQFAETISKILFEIPSSEDSLFGARGFSQYPYYNFHSGEYLQSSAKNKSYSFALSYFSNVPNISGLSFSTRISLYPLFSIKFSGTSLYEKLFKDSYSLGFYNLYVEYTRIKTETISLRWGLGGKLIHGQTNHLGPSLNLAIDVYPIYPVSLSLYGNTARVNKANVIEFSSTVNFHINRIKVFAGYKHYSANSVTINGFNVGIGVTY